MHSFPWVETDALSHIWDNLTRYISSSITCFPHRRHFHCHRSICFQQTVSVARLCEVFLMLHINCLVKYDMGYSYCKYLDKHPQDLFPYSRTSSFPVEVIINRHLIHQGYGEEYKLSLGVQGTLEEECKGHKTMYLYIHHLHKNIIHTCFSSQFIQTINVVHNLDVTVEERPHSDYQKYSNFQNQMMTVIQLSNGYWTKMIKILNFQK